MFDWKRRRGDGSSTKSSVASSAKRVVQRGAKALTRPLKRLKKAALSIASSRASRSSPSISVVVDVQVQSDNDDGFSRARSSAASDVISIKDSADDNDDISEDEEDPQAVLAIRQKSWRAVAYSFFTADVRYEVYDGRPCHFFPCAARKCTNKLGGVRRYQDTKDRNSTANLLYHARHCFGKEAVDAAVNGRKVSEKSGSIFAAFARQGQKPAHPSNRLHTKWETRAHVVKWITESSRPINIINDRELQELLTAGRPSIQVPSHFTIARDIKAAFGPERERIGGLLRDHAGALHFATDAWTSPNHRAFVAWTVHLKHEGVMFSFLLDFVEVAEVGLGIVLSCSFGRKHCTPPRDAGHVRCLGPVTDALRPLEAVHPLSRHGNRPRSTIAAPVCKTGDPMRGISR